jgi:demethylmenaquinone methyltransferase/2-methoxy-6-polyprenyl-1,4-benzoquinol methylase
MSSLALMRWLEAAPERYDAGMRWLTLGRAARVHEAVADAVPQGGRVLELGCGTGSLTARLLARGARVTALDQSPAMLELARRRCSNPAPGSVEWLERTASEIDMLPQAAFDAVVASFALSEMSAAGRAFVLRAARECLRPGGVLAVGDEVVPRGPAARAFYGLLRAPQAAAGWLLAGSVSSPLRDLESEIDAAGFELRAVRRWLAGRFAVVVAWRPA